MKILVVDDQRSARLVLREILEAEADVEVLETATSQEAHGLALEHSIALAFVDIRLADDPRNREGISLLRKLRERTSARVVMVSGLREITDVREAFRAGAEDYLLKEELSEETIRPLVDRVREQLRLEGEVHTLRARTHGDRDVPGLVGSSPVMERLRERLARVATSDRPVLVTGPSGSGKEVVVRALHALGAAPEEPLFDVNCGALPEALVEALLFGHERGAFTGADRKSSGYLSAVGRGTLFLDEVAELPLPLQAKLLRVLETRRYRAVGGTTEARFDGRVVAATHADLGQRVKSGRFREDLFHRLNVLVIDCPSLDERRSDIPALVAHFARDQPREIRFSEGAMRKLAGANWPGNLRQLRNLIDRLAVFCDEDPITENAVARELGASPAEGAASLRDLALRAIESGGSGDRLEAMERALVEEALRLAQGNKSEAARLLGVHRKRIERRVANKSAPDVE